MIFHLKIISKTKNKLSCVLNSFHSKLFRLYLHNMTSNLFLNLVHLLYLTESHNLRLFIDVFIDLIFIRNIFEDWKMDFRILLFIIMIGHFWLIASIKLRSFLVQFSIVFHLFQVQNELNLLIIGLDWDDLDNISIPFESFLPIKSMKLNVQLINLFNQADNIFRSLNSFDKCFDFTYFLCHRIEVMFNPRALTV